MVEKPKKRSPRKKKVEQLDLAKLEVIYQELRSRFERELVDHTPVTVFSSATYQQLQQVGAQIEKLRGEAGGN